MFPRRSFTKGVNMDDYLWMLLVVLLVGYAIGATFNGQRSDGTGVFVVPTENSTNTRSPGCGAFFLIVLAALAVLMLTVSQ